MAPTLQRNEVLVISVLLASEGLLIAGLVAQRARRRRAEQRNKEILRTIPDLMFLMSDDGHYLDFYARNPSDLLVPPNGFLGKHVRDVMPKELADTILASFEIARTTGDAALVDYSLPINGELRDYEARIVACEGSKFLSLVRDMTDRRRADETLRQQGLAMDAAHEQMRDLAGRLIAAQEVERARIARDLHDDISQKLALLSIRVDQLAGEASKSRVVSRLTEVKSDIDEIATDVHQLSYALHPSKLETIGLVAAIDSCCRDISARADITVHFKHSQIPRNVAPDISLCLYRIVQEALSNVVKHSDANFARVTLKGSEHRMELEIADHGCGFAPDGDHAGLGLVSMRERARSIKGELLVQSSVGAGTRVGVQVSLKSSQQEVASRQIA